MYGYIHVYSNIVLYLHVIYIYMYIHMEREREIHVGIKRLAMTSKRLFNPYSEILRLSHYIRVYYCA